MSNKTEIIKIVVDVKINYSTKEQRKECIKRAKQIVLSTSVLSTNSIIPKKSKLI
jgi:hypothetical protein